MIFSFTRRESPSGDLMDQPLLHFSKRDSWTIRDACEGVQIFGGTGSGKTTGSGAAIARSFLEDGFGGLVLTAKRDEADLWRKYCAETGRQDDLIIFDCSGEFRFNFLQYELENGGSDAGLTQNLVSVFCTIIEVLERRKESHSADAFWDRAMKQLLRNAIDLVVLSGCPLTLSAIYDVIISAPQDLDMVHEEDWQHRSFLFQCVERGHYAGLTGISKHDFTQSVKFWLKEYPALSDRTRSNIVATFTTMSDLLLRGVTRLLFCTESNVTPDMCFDGKVIVLDLPVKQFAEVGQMAQVLFKYMWQRAIERRAVAADTLPCFLWSDESQLFATSHDAVFQTTARSSRACIVYLTQNLGIYRSTLGTALTDSLMGNLQTKIFHQNTCAITNQWASDGISKCWQFRGNMSTSVRPSGLFTSIPSHQIGGSDSLEYQIIPHAFTILRKGGPQNDCAVDAVVFQGGRVFKANRKNHLFVTFAQE